MDRRFIYLFCLLVICAAPFVYSVVELARWSLSLGSVGDTDADSWVRLVLAEHLAASGEWYNHTVAALAYPQGMQSHWTRPLDLYVLLGAFAQFWQPDFKQALLHWAAFINLTFLFGIIACGMRLLRGMGIAAPGQLAFAALIAGNSFFFIYFTPGKTDHHSMLAFCYAALLCAALAPSRRNLWLAGAISGLGLWVAPEFIMAICIITFAYALVWLASGDAQIIRRAGHWLVAGALFTTLALMIERPPSSWFDIHHMRISIVHIAWLASMAGACLLLARFWLATWLVRFSVACTVALMWVEYMQLLFPRFYLGSIAEIEPYLMDYINRHTVELQGSFAIAGPVYGSFLLLLLGAALAYGARRLYMARRKPQTAFIWCALTLSALVYGALCFYQMRWIVYSVIPISLLVAAALHNAMQRLPRRSDMVQAVAMTLAVMLLMQLPLHITPWFAQETTMPKPDQGCIDALRAAAQKDGFKNYAPAPTTIFSPLITSTQIIFWTPHRAVASFYVNDTQGMYDYFSMLYPENENTLRELFAQRGVGLVMLCEKAIDPPVAPFEGRANVLEFLRLQPVHWMQPITNHIHPGVRLFRVAQ